jgi:D-3-phosphoglycerate dehydrogenase
MGFEVRGKTLALIGLGRIGAEVARRARAMEMRVVAYDPVVSTERAGQLGVELVTLDEALGLGDFISLHVPLVDATRNMINAARMQMMKPGACLINAARGGIIEEADLLAALESGHLGGAALDVFEHEPPTSSPLLGHPKLIGLPHLGASTLEAQALSGVDVAEGVLAALSGGTPRYAVNAPYIEPEDQGVLAPYIGLGRQLGALCAGLVHEPVRQYEFEYRGELSEVLTIAPIRMAMLQGLLAAATEERVTPVNAPILARDRGLRFQEFRTPDDNSYAGSVILRAVTADGPREFCGTFVHGQPHVVVADGYLVTFVPQGPLLFAYNSDRPGMIGRVGTLLGAADVNISSMDVGRTGPRQSAMMVVRLDEPCPLEVVRQIERIDGISKAISLVL